MNAEYDVGDEEINVKIPPQALHKKIRVKGKGKYGEGYQRGNLYLRISETDSATLDVVIYYGALKQLLRDENWIQANRLTKRILIKLAYDRERSANDWIRSEQIANIPCQDIFKLDSLWLTYSNNRFGFTVQKAMWEKLGGTREYSYSTLKKFGNRVDWFEEAPLFNILNLLDSWYSQEKIEARINQVQNNINELPQGYLPFLTWGYINKLSSTDQFVQKTDLDFFHSNFYIGSLYDRMNVCKGNMTMFYGR